MLRIMGNWKKLSWKELFLRKTLILKLPEKLVETIPSRLNAVIKVKSSRTRY